MSTTTFAQVYADHWVPIRELITRIVGDAHEAEDVTQDTFLRILDQWDRSDERRGSTAWIRTIARNLAIDCMRRRTRRSTTSTDVDRFVAKEPANGEERLLPALVNAVENLPRSLRLPILLHSMDGLGPREISSLTDTTPGNVKVRIHRARSMLRRGPLPLELAG